MLLARGLLSLEGKQIDNDFLARGIQLLVDGHDSDMVKTLMSKDKNMAVERHNAGSSVWRALGIQLQRWDDRNLGWAGGDAV